MRAKVIATLTVCCTLALFSASSVQAQFGFAPGPQPPQGQFMAPPQGPLGVMHAGGIESMMPVSADPGYGVIPASYQGACSNGSCGASCSGCSSCSSGSSCTSCSGKGCPRCKENCGICALFTHKCNRMPGDPCCPKFCDSCYHIWRGRFENIWLHRNGERSQGLALINTVNGLSTAVATDFADFRWEYGGRASVERRLAAFDGNASLEFVYLGMQRWNDSTITASAGLQSAYSLPLAMGGFSAITPGYDNSFAQYFAYASEFHSGEINYWFPLNFRPFGVQLSTGTGARWFGLYEDFQYDARTAAGGGTTHITTRNNLVGLQFLLAGTYHWNDCLRIRFDGKTGYFNNTSAQRSRINIPSSPFFVERQNENTETMHAEFSIQAIRQLNCHWAIYGGYQAMALDGVALAPENFNPVAPVAGARNPAGVNVSGKLYLQGIFCGCEASW